MRQRCRGFGSLAFGVCSNVSALCHVVNYTLNYERRIIRFKTSKWHISFHNSTIFFLPNSAERVFLPRGRRATATIGHTNLPNLVSVSAVSALMRVTTFEVCQALSCYYTYFKRIAPSIKHDNTLTSNAPRQALICYFIYCFRGAPSIKRVTTFTTPTVRQVLNRALGATTFTA